MTTGHHDHGRMTPAPHREEPLVALCRKHRRAGAVGAAAAAFAAYMVFEAQWLRCRRADLPVRGLPSGLSGLTILHLSDVHAGLFPTNERALRKAVDWAAPLAPDLVFLTGDILGERLRSRSSLELLSRLQPALGAYAVTGNHEYGLGKGPLARARHTDNLWAAAGITLLQDRCRIVETVTGASIAVCGADYLSGGFGLLDRGGRPVDPRWGEAFPILLIHEPPPAASPLAQHFALAFAGHTHGGQLRLPTPRGLVPLNAEKDTRLGGIYDWGQGSLIVSRGVGSSFVPMRLSTRPEATLWRLVYLEARPHTLIRNLGTTHDATRR